MKKKYLQPTAEAFDLKLSNVICDLSKSGGSKVSDPSKILGTQPTATSGVLSQRSPWEK